ncbi:hypothetical protein [Mesorhizobium sp.]|uniref:hypothetical protein n=1 Tax=Mesorhizobium sp. TaxID=1871066 RepID=UPI000FE94E88|nr:hypothetical protein [Mesorhizobium sp.]RWO63384.1 MAG: hypothetical protein EOS14_02690 [Mesorhizobium sp.]
MGPTISRRDFRTGRDNGLPSFNQRVNAFSGDTRPNEQYFSWYSRYGDVLVRGGAPFGRTAKIVPISAKHVRRRHDMF